MSTPAASVATAEPSTTPPTQAQFSTPAPSRQPSGKASTAPPVTRSALALPSFTGQTHLDFGRIDSTFRRVDRVFDIKGQWNVANAIYHQLSQLVTVELAISHTAFIRMWRTFILKRVQDVFENEKSRRTDNFVRMGRNLPLPKPLDDLLYSIGQRHSRALGTIFDAIPPPRDTTPEDW